MNGRVLVAYGSKSGSTAEIAEAIGMQLRLYHLDVTVAPAHEVRSIADYEFVILGSALYAGRWRRSAMALLKSEQRVLTARQVWLFQSGLSVTGSGPWRDPTPDAVLEIAKEIGAMRPITFAGALLPETARGLLPRLMARGRSAGEHRDWDRIASWAREVAFEIRARTGRSWSDRTIDPVEAG